MTRATIATSMAGVGGLCLGIGLFLWLAQGALTAGSRGGIGILIVIEMAQPGSAALGVCLLIGGALLRFGSRYGWVVFLLAGFLLFSIAVISFNSPEPFGLRPDWSNELGLIMEMTGLSGIFTSLVLLAAQWLARREPASDSTTSG